MKPKRLSTQPPLIDLPASLEALDDEVDRYHRAARALREAERGLYRQILREAPTEPPETQGDLPDIDPVPLSRINLRRLPTRPMVPPGGVVEILPPASGQDEDEEPPTVRDPGLPEEILED